jgi:hypothetical protein
MLSFITFREGEAFLVGIVGYLRAGRIAPRQWIIGRRLLVASGRGGGLPGGGRQFDKALPDR